MLVYGNMNVTRTNNVYAAYIRNAKLFEVIMPPDGQLMQDGKCMETACRSIYGRWSRFAKMSKRQGSPAKTGEKGETEKKREDSTPPNAGYSGMVVVQVDFNQYNLYLPDGVHVAWVYMPLDEKYIEDDAVIRTICRALAKRFDI